MSGPLKLGVDTDPAFWISRYRNRASMQVTTATQTLSTTWAKKLEIKAKRQAIMAMEREMKDRKRQEIEVCIGSTAISKSV